MTDEQIKHMVDRFLGWKLPENFSPDAGISFKPWFNENLPHVRRARHEPSGTNLFDATQAEAMVRYMIEGMPSVKNLPRIDQDNVPCATCGERIAVCECRPENTSPPPAGRGTM